MCVRICVCVVLLLLKVGLEFNILKGGHSVFLLLKTNDVWIKTSIIQKSGWITKISIVMQRLETLQVNTCMHCVQHVY